MTPGWNDRQWRTRWTRPVVGSVVFARWKNKWGRRRWLGRDPNYYFWACRARTVSAIPYSDKTYRRLFDVAWMGMRGILIGDGSIVN